MSAKHSPLTTAGRPRYLRGNRGGGARVGPHRKDFKHVVVDLIGRNCRSKTAVDTSGAAVTVKLRQDDTVTAPRLSVATAATLCEPIGADQVIEYGLLVSVPTSVAPT